MSPFLLLLLPLLLQLTVETAASKVPAIIVFGDSTVDAGNNNAIPTVLKSNFRPYGRDFFGGQPTGRFSNGRVPTDFVSEGFGLKPTIPAYLDPAFSIADFASGVSFASAGTGLDNATSDVLSVIPLWKEVELFEEYQLRLREYMGGDRAAAVVRKAVYIVSVGTNDFLENYFSSPRRSSRMTVQQFEDFLVAAAGDFLTTIYRLGARKVSFTGLSPMGCLPLERASNLVSGCLEAYNEVSRRFNSKMKASVADLAAALPGYRLVFTELYDAFADIVNNPSDYGFENVATGCCASGRYEMGYLCNRWNPFTCIDANKYVFWDAFHPTEKTNRLLAYHNLNTSLYQFL